MSDLEMTRLCAEAMGYSTVLRKGDHVHVMPLGPTIDGIYWPLDNDAQAMALLERFRLAVFWDTKWCVDGSCHRDNNDDIVYADALNRAIVECVAKMQAKP